MYLIINFRIVWYVIEFVLVTVFIYGVMTIYDKNYPNLNLTEKLMSDEDITVTLSKKQLYSLIVHFISFWLIVGLSVLLFIGLFP